MGNGPKAKSLGLRVITLKGPVLGELHLSVEAEPEAQAKPTKPSL